MDGCVASTTAENVQRYLVQGNAMAAPPAMMSLPVSVLQGKALVVVGLGKAAATGSTASACLALLTNPLFLI
jgi:hypothetical protein